ncbi:hypothetical protein [Psychrobium sp. 1_MG-2023]|uniref:hypothetical protein n=1 Tax=Psychrobium sp. 1_MG-2023 TaxID=3062624 RepID=UPI000C339D48|nr:hypothetical protein [Psychrobium sp. 1_MG-2023]MDP2559908.1 hypothetical protein [Psychrobium sp. 1_MG-2023]PKF58991.1 hypothetical protein CW748_02040 [Alteromonadales bacterium alter-6D02]
MSERTAENKKSELTLALVLIVVVAMLGVPFALSLFRESSVLVAGLLQATPFVLIGSAIASMLYVRKNDK